MNKLMERMKKNNKGFTLVELIVVIAVLAIITVVVAPMYLNYVEKARQGTDENTLGEIAHVAEIAYVETEAAKPDLAEYIDVSVAVTNGSATITAGDDKMQALILETIPSGQYTFKSDKYKNGTVTIRITKGVSNWEEQLAAANGVSVTTNTNNNGAQP